MLLLAFGFSNNLKIETMFGKYNQKGIRETGFDNYSDHINYVNPSNPEYQQECQDAEMTERINQENAIKCRNDDLDNQIDLHWIEELLKESELERKNAER